VARAQAAVELSRERFAAQLLAGGAARDPVAVVERLLAIQAQDDRGFRLAVRARSEGLTAADVDHALSTERSLIVSWLNRGTLQLVRREDYAWLHALTTPQLLTGTARRLSQEGVTASEAERAVGVIGRALACEGPLTRVQLRDRLDVAGVPIEGQAVVHLLALASHRGLIARGPVIDNRQVFVLVRDWIGSEERATVDRERALAELARRYLAGHGPADERDLARWAGLPLRDARAGLRAVASELVRGSEGRVRLASKGKRVRLRPAGSRLLGAFDPVLLGWRTREWVTGPHDSRIVSGGVFRPFTLVDGVAAGIWRITAGRLDIEPFADLSQRDAAALQADGRDVLRFLGIGGCGR
jgi:hypothetical protein